MSKKQDALVKQLQKIKENVLSQAVLVRLFRTFGYDEVDFHGGPDEQGKDLICWRRDELDDVELGVVQVKRYKPTRKASDTASFSEVVTQLSQCVETEVPYTDGQSYLPSAVYFVTPYEIDTRTLNSRFAKVAALRQFRVKIIDGAKLARLLRERVPSVAADLLGVSDQISQAIAPQLSNQVLMSALGFQATRHIKEFYTDIDIAVGHVHARYFLSSQFHPKSRTFDLREHEWESLKSALDIITSVFSVDLIAESSNELDVQLAQKKQQWHDWKEENRRLNASVQQLVVELREMREKIETVAERGAPKSRKKRDEILAGVKSAIEVIDSGRQDSADRRKEAPFDEQIRCLLGDFRKLRVQYAKTDAHETRHRANEPTVAVRITATGKALTEKLRAAREQIRNQAKRLQRKRNPAASELKKFIEACQWMFSNTARILRNPTVAEIVGLTPTDVSISKYTRLSFPIDLVFDTDQNVAVLGEAGAGKSTALQMYAFRHYESGDRDRLVIFAPLSQVVRLAPAAASTSASKPPPRPLDAGLIAFLRSLGASYALEEFQADAQHGGTILLDSIDEAFSYAPWVIESLVAFAEKYPKLQLITSSRVSGEYAERIPFVGISLMPFTDKQQIQFVSNWFGDDPKGHISTICDHLRQHEEVADVVRNPLLATAMCALQEHNVPLPTSEIRLYQEWVQSAW